LLVVCRDGADSSKSLPFRYKPSWKDPDNRFISATIHADGAMCLLDVRNQILGGQANFTDLAVTLRLVLCAPL
jgi:hypothetical protein